MEQQRRVHGIVLAIALSLFGSGCATMIRGMDEPLQIMSEPPGARALIGTGQSCVTPCSIALSRSTSTAITFEKEGCERTMVSVFPTLAAAGVILGGVIDYGTGAVYNLQPNPVVASLRCGAPASAVTPTVSSTALSPTVAATPPQSRGMTSTSENLTPAADTQLRNAEREFRAGRMSLEEFRQIKKVLQAP